MTADSGQRELLATWEAGLARPESGRTLLLHRVARPRAGTEELMSVPIGEREADLYALRRALFGERMDVLIECGACGEVMETDLDARALADRPAPPAQPLRVSDAEWVVEFRLPAVADLAAAAAGALDAADARRRLIGRCVLAASRGGEQVSADELPERVVALIGEAAAAADPTAEVALNATCPECGEATRAELDIASYLWTELDAWARDLLLDVHVLARSYGWREPDVMALSPLRRRYYLELCADA